MQPSYSLSSALAARHDHVHSSLRDGREAKAIDRAMLEGAVSETVSKRLVSEGSRGSQSGKNNIIDRWRATWRSVASRRGGRRYPYESGSPASI
jgi:hypothetical protein